MIMIIIVILIFIIVIIVILGYRNAKGTALRSVIDSTPVWQDSGGLQRSRSCNVCRDTGESRQNFQQVLEIPNKAWHPRF